MTRRSLLPPAPPAAGRLGASRVVRRAACMMLALGLVLPAAPAPAEGPAGSAPAPRDATARRGYGVLTSVPRPDQAAAGVRFEVEEDGLYAIRAADLAAAGLSLPLPSDRLRLFDARGEVALDVRDGGDGMFDVGADDHVVFFGFYPRGRHTTRPPFNVASPYWLMVDGRATRQAPPAADDSEGGTTGNGDADGAAAPAAPRRYRHVSADEARAAHPDPVRLHSTFDRQRLDIDYTHHRWPGANEEETDFYFGYTISTAAGLEVVRPKAVFVGATPRARYDDEPYAAMIPELRIKLYGVSALNRVDVRDHVVEVLVNDLPVGRIEWDGVRPMLWESPLPWEVFDGHSELQLELRIPEDRLTMVDEMYLDWYEFGYPGIAYFPARFGWRPFTPEALPEGGADRGIELEINSWDRVPFRLVDPQGATISEPVEHVAIRGEEGIAPERYRIRFAPPPPDSGPGEDKGAGQPRLAVFLEEAIKPIIAADLAPWIDPVVPAFDDDAGLVVRNVLVTHRLLWPEAQRLAAWRHATGTPTLLVEIGAVYDEYAGGFVSNESLRRLLLDLWALPEGRRPVYLTLFGDSSFDYKGINERMHPDRMISGSSLLPLVYHSSGHYNRAVFPADNVFADLEGTDYKPELAVGRIPAATPAEAKAYVDKVLAYETADPDAAWLARAVLVSSWERSFQSLLDAAARDGLPGFVTDFVIATLESRQDDVQRMIDGFNEGCGVLYYVGHGGSFVWRVGPVDFAKQEDLFTTREIAGLSNRGRYPIIFVSSCYTVSFDHSRAIGEEFILQPGRGGIAVLGSPWKTSVTPNHRFNASVMTYLHDPARRAEMSGDPEATSVRLGDAFLATKRHLLLDTNTMIGFTLLGDPCLKVEVGRFRRAEAEAEAEAEGEGGATPAGSAAAAAGAGGGTAVVPAAIEAAEESSARPDMAPKPSGERPAAALAP